MFRRFINGLVFGAGFSIALIAILEIYATYFVERTFERFDGEGSTTVENLPPANAMQNKFLGTTAIYSGNALDHRSKVLASGDGVIQGSVTAGGQPVSNLRLRLSLNSAAMSSWTSTDVNGVYRIAVPFGSYEVSGYELDTMTVHGVLAGFIEDPLNRHTTPVTPVEEGTVGEGLNLKYVLPVVKKQMARRVSLDSPPRLEWEPYPGASAYRIQITASEALDDYRTSVDLFPWSQEPVVTDPYFPLAPLAHRLESGYFYSYQVKALNEKRQAISNTPEHYGAYDFKVE